MRRRLSVNRRATEQIDAEVVRLIADGRGFAVETVLSTPKYRDDVEAARAKGFHIGLIYVSIHPPELAPRRVSERCKGGSYPLSHLYETLGLVRLTRLGHDVPWTKA